MYHGCCISYIESCVARKEKIEKEEQKEQTAREALKKRSEDTNKADTSTAEPLEAASTEAKGTGNDGKQFPLLLPTPHYTHKHTPKA